MNGKRFSELYVGRHDRETSDRPERTTLSLHIGALFRAVCMPLAESKSLDDRNDGKGFAKILETMAIRHRVMLPLDAAKLLDGNPQLGSGLPHRWTPCREVYDMWESVGTRLQWEAGARIRSMQESYSYGAFMRMREACENVNDWYDARGMLASLLARRHTVTLADDPTQPPEVAEWSAAAWRSFTTLAGL